MNPDDFDARMRRREHYHQERILPDLWIVVRLDGRSFTKLTRDFAKPFDIRFSRHMRYVASTLMIAFDVRYTYTESDEISLVLAPDWDLFNRSHEKLVSLFAAEASAYFSLRHEGPAAFDARVWLGNDVRDVVDYMSWRMADAERCALNGYAYWTLRKDGLTARQATRVLEGKSKDFKHDLLLEHDINFNDLPAWEKRGIAWHWGKATEIGHNPITGLDVETERRVLHCDDVLPRGDIYRDFVERAIGAEPLGI